MSTSLREAQQEMARFLRDPQGRGAPAGIEERRLQVYRDLVYRNIEGFISSGFPLLRSLYDDAAWEARVRDFILKHRCSTPLFLRISEEFLDYLTSLGEGELRPFEAELAHYEWLELAVDVDPAEVPALVDDDVSPDRVSARLAGTARLASYAFPVHRIGPSFQPEEGGEPSFLLVYRTRDAAVQFMELNQASARLLYELGERKAQSVSALLGELAQEWGMAPEQMATFAWQQLREFHELGIIAFEPLDVKA